MTENPVDPAGEAAARLTAAIRMLDEARHAVYVLSAGGAFRKAVLDLGDMLAGLDTIRAEVRAYQADTTEGPWSD